MRPAHVSDVLAVYAIGSGEPMLLMSYPHSPLLPAIARSAEFDPESGFMRRMSGMRYRGQEETKTPWRGEFSEWRTLQGIKVPYRNVAFWEDQGEPYGIFEIEGAEHNVDVSEKISSKLPGA